MASEAPRYWVGVVARAHVRQGVAGGFCMFAHGRHTAVQKLRPGDGFVYYAPTETLGDKQAVRRFCAIGIVSEGEPEMHHMSAGQDGWRRPARFLDAREADIYPLLPKLGFITDQGHWGMHFRRSLFMVATDDFRRIASAMGVAAHFQ